MFYKSSPCVTNPIQSMFYNMPCENAVKCKSFVDLELQCKTLLCDISFHFYAFLKMSDLLKKIFGKAWQISIVDVNGGLCKIYTVSLVINYCVLTKCMIRLKLNSRMHVELNLKS